MRVLLVEGSRQRGGQTRHVCDLARGLMDKGHEVMVASGDTEPAGRNERAGVPYIILPFRSFLDMVTMVSLTQIMRRGQFDIVHTHGLRAGLLGRVAARLAGRCKLVHSVHLMPEDIPQSPGFLGFGARHLYRSVDACLGACTDRIITMSEDLHRRVACRLVPPDRLVTVHSGVDLSQYNEAAGREEGRHRLGLPLGSKVVGTVARFTRQKNLDDLIAASRSICRLRDDVCFALVGDGPEYARLKRTVQDYGLAHKVFLPGYMNDVPAFLRGFDIFVLSSLYEGHPLSLLEAMAAGLPVVATRITGICETVVDGLTGFVVPPRDPKALATVVLKLLADDKLAEAMGEEGRERVSALFSLERMIDGVESVYLELMDRRSLGEPVSAVR